MRTFILKNASFLCCTCLHGGLRGAEVKLLLIQAFRSQIWDSFSKNPDYVKRSLGLHGVSASLRLERAF